MKNGAAILLLTLAACASSTMKSNDADAYIRSAADRFRAAFNSGNADALSAFYTDDAVLLLPNAEPARGAAGVRQAFAAMSGARPTLDFSADRIMQQGDLATEVGHYTMTMGPGRDQGNYVAVWRRQPDGSWKMVADSVVSSVPMNH